MTMAKPRSSCLWAVVVCAVATPVFGACPTGKQAKNAAALTAIEQRWALALEKKDAEAVGCLLAPEFLDSDPDGVVRDRQAVLAAIAGRMPGTNRLEELKVFIDGDTAVVHGTNRVLDENGRERASVRFTDTFIYRKRKWLAIAGHESLIKKPEAADAKQQAP